MPRSICPHGYIGKAIERCPECSASRRSSTGGGFGEFLPKPPKFTPPKLPDRLVLPRRRTIGECLVSGGHALHNGKCDYCNHHPGDVMCDCPECVE